MAANVVTKPINQLTVIVIKNYLKMIIGRAESYGCITRDATVILFYTLGHNQRLRVYNQRVTQLSDVLQQRIH